MPIRVLHVVDSLGQGGLENGLVNLIDRLNPATFEHIVLAMRGFGPNADRLPTERVRVECLEKTRADRVQVMDLARAIRRFEPDIVHSRNWGTIEAVLAGRWLRSCAVIHSEHGLEAEVEAKEPWRRTCFRRLAFELAHRVLSVSYHLRELHASRTGFAADKISVIHNGVDSRRFRPDASARIRARRDLQLAEDEFCIGCVGNLLPVKDHLTLLKAAAGAGAANWRVFLVGKGPELPTLQTFVDDHIELRGRVSFLGSRNDVPELLNAMDVYVLPSLAEGISNSLLEAMATGLPVLATATGGNPEVVADRQSGLLFPVGEWRELIQQLLRLEHSRELRTQLGRGAVSRTRDEFAIDSMVRKYERLYQEMTPMAISSLSVAEGL